MDYLIELLKQNEYGELLITFIISMVPVAELRLAIPTGVGMGLPPLTAMLVSILGNMIPVPFIILFIRRIFEWMRKRSEWLGGIADRLTVRAEGKWEKVHKYQFFGLMIFVAIPLPGTGAWTGSLIAALMNMRLRNALPAIFAGVIIAGIVVTGLTVGFTHIFQ